MSADTAKTEDVAVAEEAPATYPKKVNDILEMVGGLTLMEASELVKAAGLIHFLSGDEKGLVAGGYGDPGEVLGF